MRNAKIMHVESLLREGLVDRWIQKGVDFVSLTGDEFENNPNSMTCVRPKFKNVAYSKANLKKCGHRSCIGEAAACRGLCANVLGYLSVYCNK